MEGGGWSGSAEGARRLVVESAGIAFQREIQRIISVAIGSTSETLGHDLDARRDHAFHSRSNIENMLQIRVFEIVRVSGFAGV